jgi:hypothetical protein
MMSKDFKTGFLVGVVVTVVIAIILSQTVWKREGFQTAALSTMTDLYGRDFNIVAFPRGMILMWSGSVTEIPRGWALCDGTNGTPDLRGKFVLGANAGTGQALGSSGGASSQSLSGTTGGRILQWSSARSGGLGSSIPTMPPFYSLAYIMKL